MFWFNYTGLMIIAVILMPNIVYAIKCKNGFDDSRKNKALIVFEQTGRYGCLIFMIFNVPYVCFGFWFDGAPIVYIAVNAALCAAYIICWAVLWNKSNGTKALLLSLLPSCVFLFGGAMLANIPLLVCSAIFAPCHISISCKNANYNSSGRKKG